MFPTITAYNDAIRSNGGNVFNHLSNLSFLPSRTTPIKIYSYGSGSYAVVFKAKDKLKEYAIRCFISAESENINRYKSIDRYLKGLNESWITNIELFEKEINISGSYYPVIKMDWVEGKLINKYISQVLQNNYSLTELQEEIVNVSKSLEANKIGHGDIQCGNVIVSQNPSGRNIIKLIDYDGMYIPVFASRTNLENGRSEFQHPNRSEIKFDEKIDRFSFWVILGALEALKYDKSLWLEIMQGGYNTLDNLLFTGDDFVSFNNSKLVKRLYSLNKPSLNFYLNKLKGFCIASPNKIERPILFDNNNSPVNEEYIVQPEKQFKTNLSGIDIITSPPGAAILSSTFQRIGVTPFTIDKIKYLNKTIIIANGKDVKQVKIESHHQIINITF